MDEIKNESTVQAILIRIKESKSPDEIGLLLTQLTQNGMTSQSLSIVEQLFPNLKETAVEKLSGILPMDKKPEIEAAIDKFLKGAPLSEEEKGFLGASLVADVDVAKQILSNMPSSKFSYINLAPCGLLAVYNLTAAEAQKAKAKLDKRMQKQMQKKISKAVKKATKMLFNLNKEAPDYDKKLKEIGGDMTEEIHGGYFQGEETDKRFERKVRKFDKELGKHADALTSEDRTALNVWVFHHYDAHKGIPKELLDMIKKEPPDRDGMLEFMLKQKGTDEYKETVLQLMETEEQTIKRHSEQNQSPTTETEPPTPQYDEQVRDGKIVATPFVRKNGGQEP